MDILRSIVFNIIFWAWGAFCNVILSPTLLMPRKIAYMSNQLWVYGIFWLLRNIMGIHLKVEGEENKRPTPVIYACKHQSTWETAVFHYVVRDPSIVLKKELMWIPFFGWYLKKLDMIPISRSKKQGMKDLKTMLRATDKAVSQNQPIVIFPEGTRSIPGEKGNYQSGIASIYQYMKTPVVPVALNSGCYWPRRGFFKKSGTITLRFLEPIEPGLSRQEFMNVLESRIEKESLALAKQAEEAA